MPTGDSKRSQRTIRIIALSILFIGVCAGTGWLFFTHHGYEIRHHPNHVGQHLLTWISSNPVRAAAIFLLLYVTMTLLAMPVWVLQIIVGHVMSRLFGIFWGVVWAITICQIAATISAVITFYFSHWLAADWFHQKVESKIQKLRRLDDKLGHNGFLVVMAVRLIHIMPFGISNYAFGLLTITGIDVAIGTFLGGIPGVMMYVIFGANYRLIRGWHFITGYLLLNLVLLVPVVLRYLRPQWFRKIGVE